MLCFQIRNEFVLLGRFYRRLAFAGVTSVIPRRLLVMEIITVIVMRRIVMFGPRFQVDVWQLSARHSLVVTVAIDCRLDFSHVHRSILVPASTPSSALQLSSEGAAEVPKMSVFTTRCYASRGTSHGSVSVSVCGCVCHKSEFY